MFSYALSEPDAGSDAAAMTTRAVRDGDGWVLNGMKRWITNAGVSRYYTVMAVTDPDAGSRGISAFVVHADDEGFTLGRTGAQARHQGLADARDLLRRRAATGRPHDRRPRHRA